MYYVIGIPIMLLCIVLGLVCIGKALTMNKKGKKK
jgi:hypothetical protein